MKVPSEIITGTKVYVNSIYSHYVDGRDEEQREQSMDVRSYCLQKAVQKVVVEKVRARSKHDCALGSRVKCTEKRYF